MTKNGVKVSDLLAADPTVAEAREVLGLPRESALQARIEALEHHAKWAVGLATRRHAELHKEVQLVETAVSINQVVIEAHGNRMDSLGERCDVLNDRCDQWAADDDSLVPRIDEMGKRMDRIVNEQIGMQQVIMTLGRDEVTLDEDQIDRWRTERGLKDATSEQLFSELMSREGVSSNIIGDQKCLWTRRENA